MNENDRRLLAATVVFASLATVTAAGCAGQETRVAGSVESEEPQAGERAAATALQTMEAYLAHMDADADRSQPSAHGVEPSAAETDRATDPVVAASDLASEPATDAVPPGIAVVEPDPTPAAVVAAAVESPPVATEIDADTAAPDPATVYFDFDSREVSARDRELLARHAEFLHRRPELVLLISGHADSRGPKEYNDYLSRQRAEGVARVLREQGIADSRLVVRALGAEQPAGEDLGWREHRRVELEYQDRVVVGTP